MLFTCLLDTTSALAHSLLSRFLAQARSHLCTLPVKIDLTFLKTEITLNFCVLLPAGAILHIGTVRAATVVKSYLVGPNSYIINYNKLARCTYINIMKPKVLTRCFWLLSCCVMILCGDFSPIINPDPVVKWIECCPRLAENGVRPPLGHLLSSYRSAFS